MKSRISIRFVVVSAVLAAVLQNGSVVSGDDLVVVRHRKKPIFVEDLTGVPYTDAVAAVSELSRDWTLELWPPLDGTRSPLRHRWKPGAGATLMDYYRLGLRDVLWHSIRKLVYDRFLVEYPDRTGAYSPEEFSRFVDAYAETVDEFKIAMATELAARRTGAELEGALERAFPGLNAKYAHFDLIEKERPYFILRARCFRSHERGVARSWMSGYLRPAIQDYHLRSEWRANRPKYIARIAVQTGECRALVFRNSQPNDAVDSAALAEELTTEGQGIYTVLVSNSRATGARKLIKS